MAHDDAPSRFSDQRSARVSSLAIVVALHGAAIAAVLLAKPALIERIIDEPPEIYNIAPPDEPPPPAPLPSERHDIPTPPPVFSTPVLDPVIADPQPVPIPMPDWDFAEAAPTPPSPTPPSPAPLVEAQFTRSALASLQPPYPAPLLRAEQEGAVTIRIHIDARGRVTGIEKISADHDLFFDATRRHAMRHWRFEPATRGGRPEASSLVRTVQFRIT